MPGYWHLRVTSFHSGVCWWLKKAWGPVDVFSEWEKGHLASKTLHLLPLMESTTAFQCPMLPVAGTCDPPAAINWPFHMSAATPSVVAPSLLLVLQSGIHCLTVCAIQLLGQISFDGLWKPTCLPVVSVSLTVHKRCFLRIRAIQMYIYLLTYFPSKKLIFTIYSNVRYLPFIVAQ